MLRDTDLLGKLFIYQLHAEILKKILSFHEVCCNKVTKADKIVTGQRCCTIMGWLRPYFTLIVFDL